MTPEPLPVEVADRLGLSRHQPALMLTAWLPGPAASPDGRARLTAALEQLAGDRAAGPTLHLEILGNRARRLIADTRPQLHARHPQRHALDDIDRHLANHRGRLLITAIPVHR